MAAKIEKVFVKMTTEDEQKSLSTFIHWPSHLKPLTNPPTTSPITERRPVCLVLHPHPKMGGNASNNVVDFLCNIFSNGYYLSYREKNADPNSFAQLYDVSHMGPRTQRQDLIKNEKNGTFTSQLLGPLKQESIPNIYNSMSSTPPNLLPSPPPGSAPGIITVRFNSSGVEDSDGKATWTGATSTEVEDVITILRWIFHPQSKIFPTDLFIIGYSFGASILSSALHRVLVSNCSDKSTTESMYYSVALQKNYQALSLHLKNTLRGTVFLALPCGFFARVLLGSHISRLRSLSTYLCQDKQQPAGDLTEKKLVGFGTAATSATSQAPPPMMYFILDQDDEITGPQTLVNIILSLPFPTNDDKKIEMLQLLKTGTGHSFRGAEHILALLLMTHFCGLIQHHDSIVGHGGILLNKIDKIQQKRQDGDEEQEEQDDEDTTISRREQNSAKKRKNDPKNDPKKDPKKEEKDAKEEQEGEEEDSKTIPPEPIDLYHNPSLCLHKVVYRDEFFRVYFYDMNLWIPLLIIFGIIGRVLYANYFEAHVRRELKLDIAEVVVDGVVRVVEELSGGQ